MNELVDVIHPIDVDDSNIQSGSGLMIRKTKPKLRLKPNATLLVKDQHRPEMSTSEEKTKEQLLMLQSDEDIMVAWQKSAVEYNKLVSI
ncbi:unnamed protein product [Onchocerca flexuosa]|uniref:Uncharacterized protein n=1 Tax=Onchocerca flexuosa TaxID=387005 RepID=A0A183HXA0_9BILA|nr:unnamed protein product [Onchocerca flexuosa]